MPLYQVRALRTYKKRNGSTARKREIRRFYCDTIEQAREYFDKPYLTLLGEVKEASR